MQFRPRLSLLVGALVIAGCASAPGQQTPAIAVNQPTDNQLTCPQITAQINQMNDVLGIQEGEMRNAEAMGLATGVAVNAAVYSGAVGSMAGSVPFMGQALGAVGQMNRMNKEQAEAYAAQAMNRRNVLTGIYAGRDCGS
jgi:hypothetical protein